MVPGLICHVWGRAVHEILPRLIPSLSIKKMQQVFQIILRDKIVFFSWGSIYQPIDTKLVETETLISCHIKYRRVHIKPQLLLLETEAIRKSQKMGMPSKDVNRKKWSALKKKKIEANSSTRIDAVVHFFHISTPLFSQFFCSFVNQFNFSNLLVYQETPSM